MLALLFTPIVRISAPAALVVLLLALLQPPEQGLLAQQAIIAWQVGPCFALAVLLGTRLLPALLLLSWTAQLLQGLPACPAALRACIDVAAAGGAAWAVRHTDMRPSLVRLYDVLLLTLLGALGCGLLATALRLAALAASGPQHGDQPWAPFLLARALGVLAVSPFVLVWGHRPPQWYKLGRARLEAFLLLLALLCSAASVAAVWGSERSAQTPAMLFVILPVLLWAATRFGQRGATAGLFSLLCAAGLCAACIPHGSLLLRADVADAEMMVAWQTYLGGSLLGVLILGSIIEERRAAMRLRDEFLLVASHELKTPLTALMLGVENLERRMQRQSGSEASAYLRKLNNCQTQIDKLARLVDGLLDLSHFSEKELRLQLAPHNLQQLMAQAVSGVASQAAQVRCNIDCNTPVAVWGSYDATRLEQLLRILLDNACKYGAGQPIELSLIADAHHARIIIEDHGIGIAAEDLRRIFLQFERAVSARSYGGLGLGLFIARKIALAHGGEMWAERCLENGARFVVRLPRDAQQRQYEGPI